MHRLLAGVVSCIYLLLLYLLLTVLMLVINLTNLCLLPIYTMMKTAIIFSNLIRNWYIMAVHLTTRDIVGLLICSGVIRIILVMLQYRWVADLRLSWNSFWIWILTIRAYIHIRRSFLLQGRPSLLSDQRIVIFVLSIILKKRLRRRRLTLVVVSTYITTDVFTLVKIRIEGIFINSFFIHVHIWSHHVSSPACLICVV